MISMMVKNHSSVPNVKVHLMELNPLTLMKEHTRGSNVWIEIQGKHQKILICTAYRKFSDLVTPGQMSGTEQRERWKLFMDQAKSASKEGLVLVLSR